MERKTTRQRQLDNIRRIQQERDNDFFFDKWESNFDQQFERTRKTIVRGWLIALVASLVFWGVMVWAVVQLVQWITSK